MEVEEDLHDSTSNTDDNEDLLTSEDEIPRDVAAIQEPKNETSTLSCIVCSFKVDNSQKLLQHLLEDHSLVIGDCETIANLSSYLNHWNRRWQEEKQKSKDPFKEFCSTINAKELPDSKEVKSYYLLCDVLEEDKCLRKNLQEERLSQIIEQQQIERYDNAFHRKCLFCKERYKDRRLYFQHMFNIHNFNMGLPDNLVYINELLDLIQSKINKYLCIYCEKTFKSYSVLKLHMRKKKHFKINPKNKIYDRYYIINYLEAGKNWEQIQQEKDDDSDFDPEKSKLDNWDEWEEEQAETTTKCLFCENLSPTADASIIHMKQDHHFDLRQLINNMEIDFYGTIKVVNFIRSEVKENKCLCCQMKFDTKDHLLQHLKENAHFKLDQDAKLYDDPKYLYPVIENDQLLCVFEDADFSDEDREKEIGSDATLDIKELQSLSFEEVEEMLRRREREAKANRIQARHDKYNKEDSSD